MKEKLRYLVVSMILMFAICLPNQVFAGASHDLSLGGVICPESVYTGQTDGKEIAYACMDAYLNGDLDDQIIQEGDEIPAGSLIMAILNYSPGPRNEVVALNASLGYDSTKWTSLLQEGEEFYDEDQFPKSGRKVTWESLFNVRKPGDISFYVDDTANTPSPLNSNTELGYVFLKLNDGATGDISLKLTDEPGDTDLSDADGEQVRPYSLKGIGLEVKELEEEKSSDASLKTLTVKNGTTTYTLDPVFTPGSTEVTSYTVKVPNNITSVDIDATVNESNATILPGGLGTKTPLSIGDNSYSIVVSAQDGTTVTYTVHVYRLSNDATLSNLTTDGTTVPGFASGTKTYTLPDVAATKTTMTIGATVTDTGKAKIVSGTGTVNLVAGNNSFDVKIEAEDGTTETYTIKVKKLSNDVKLASLSVTSTPLGTLSPAFSSTNTTGYTYTYDVTASQVTVSATVSDTGKAKIAIVDVSTNASATGTPTSNTATETFANTVTKVSVIVTAEDGTVQAYPITLSRSKSTNTYLSSLSINETTLDQTFVKTTRTYTAKVAPNVTSVTVNAVAEDAPRATIKSITGNTNLQYGNNPIVITVKAESGLEETYTINLTREKSNVATLEDLTVDGTTIPGFNKNTFTYTISGSVAYNKTSVTIGTVKTDPNSTVTGDGSVNLTTGPNQIVVKVTAQNGVDFNEYKINIERDKNTDNSVLGLTVAGKTPTLNGDGNYEVTLPNGKTTLEPSDVVVTIPDGATVTKGNAINLSTESVNTYQFTVRSESGVDKTYTILITREPSTATTLSKVTLNIGTDSSRSCVMSGDTCKITVPADTTNFTLTTEIPATSTISPVDGTPFTFATTESTKNITLTVTAEDRTTTKDYTLVVEREKSTVNTLDSVTITSGGVEVGTWNQAFASGTNSYTVDVAGDVDTINIAATLTDPRAEIISGTGDHTLNVGDNPITIRVKSESGAFNDYNIKVVRAKKTDNSLLDLTVDGTTVPGFNKDILEYTLTNVPNATTSILIGVTKSDTDATVAGTGRKALSTGPNTFEVTVTAQDGTPRTYTIHVTRDKNDEARLSSLVINGQTLDKAFDRDTFDYEITVDATKDTLSPNEITAIPVDSNATVVKDAALSLSTTMDNYYEINVTAEDGHTQKTYTIKVIRPKSSDATLKAVNVTGGSLSPAFSATNNSYTITLPTGSTNFDIEGIANVGTTQVFGNGSYTLADGTVTLTTRAEDGTEGTYTFTITQALSNDATLASLSVTDHNLDKTFGPAVLGYDIGNVTYGTTQLVVNAVPTNIDSTVQYFLDGVEQSSNIINIPNILGAKQITVTVTAPDGETQESYTIDYTLVQSSNAFLKMITPSVGILNPTFVKTTKDYEVEVNGETMTIDFTIEAEDNNSTVAVNGDTFHGSKTITMSELVVGENLLTILVTAQDGTTETYTVKVKKELGISEVITSDIFGHTIDDDYIQTVAVDTTGSEMKDQLDNPNEYLEIWTADESAQVADDDTLATGMIVKLMINGSEKDRKLVVIKGDTSGEGVIDLYDAVKILNHVLDETLPLTGAYLEAGYMNEDIEVDLYDAIMILNYVLEN